MARHLTDIETISNPAVPLFRHDLREDHGILRNGGISNRTVSHGFPGVDEHGAALLHTVAASSHQLPQDPSLSSE